MTESQADHEVEVINLREFPSPQEVISAFWREYEGPLREAVRTFDARNKLMNVLNLDGEGAGQTFDDHLFAHEKAFVDHILNRLLMILNEVRTEDATDPAYITFNINTTMLYDVDETLCHIGYGIRPVAHYLLEFLGKMGIRLALASTRQEDRIKRDLFDGDLQPLLRHFNNSLYPVYSPVTTFSKERNPNHRSFSFYPDHIPESLDSVLKMAFNFTDEEIQTFMRDEWPILMEFLARQEVLQKLIFPLPIADLENSLRGLEVSVATTEDEYVTALKSACFDFISVQKLQEALQVQIAARGFKIIDLLGDKNDSVIQVDLERISAEIFEQISMGEEFNLKQECALKKTITMALAAVLDYLRPFGPNHSDALIEASLKECSSVLNFSNLDFYVKSQEAALPAAIFDHCLSCFPNARILQPDSRQQMIDTVGHIKSSNRNHIHAVNSKLFHLLNVSNGSTLELEIEVALQRLSAARKQLDEGAAFVSIAVDDKQAAEVMDQLLQGNLTDRDTGEKVDGYALFGLQEYRGRLFLIHVGKCAEFSVDALEKRIKEAKAA